MEREIERKREEGLSEGNRASLFFSPSLSITVAILHGDADEKKPTGDAKFS